MKRFCAAFIVSTAAVTALAQQPAEPIEWRYVGADQAHTKYSTADEITAANVEQLEIAWQWEPNEMPMPELGARPSSFQATPIMIDNVLYVSTAYNRVAALDAETGGGAVGVRFEGVRAGGAPRLHSPRDCALARRRRLPHIPQ